MASKIKVVHLVIQQRADGLSLRLVRVRALCSRTLVVTHLEHSTDVRYITCTKCCKRIGLDPALAIPKPTRKKLTIDAKVDKIFRNRRRESMSLI